MFLANYADVLTDAPLNAMIERFRASNMVGGLLAVPPQSAFHCVNLGEGDEISSISTLQEMPLWENGGYLMFRPEVFDHLEEDCDLIGDVCAPLAKQGQMMACPAPGLLAPRRHRQGAHRAWKRPTRAAPDRGCCGTPPTGTRCRPPSRSCRAGSTVEETRAETAMLRTRAMLRTQC